MTFQSELLGLPPTGLPVLRDLIHQRTGLFYDDGRMAMLGERVAPLVIELGFRSFLDLYYLLKYEAEAEADGARRMWLRIMDVLTVQETYFWREIDQIKAIVCRAVGSVAKDHHGVIRIWSAPCATGEEPLTIAMALNEAGWFDRASVEIHASDGSPAAIARARAGQYRRRSFRALPPSLKEKYFRDQGEVSTPVPELAARISSWSVVNLMAPSETAPYVHCPILFCRNAFIYFSQRSIRAFVARCAESMPTPGYLCVGASESLLGVTTAFSLEELDGAFVYVKR